jgi:hypothetical protein
MEHPITPPPEPPMDTEILEFLLNQFQMHSPKMNGQHSWRFMNDYCMGKAVGRSAKDAVIACMKKQAKRNTELEGCDDTVSSGDVKVIARAAIERWGHG